MEPTVDRDRDPVWSPDGKQVAFIRIADGGPENSGRCARRTGEPRSIHVASIADGTGRQIWKALMARAACDCRQEHRLSTFRREASTARRDSDRERG
jgi:Tol biopolymer transport system component